MRTRGEKGLWILLVLGLLGILAAKVSWRRSETPGKRSSKQGRLVHTSQPRLAQNYGRLPLSFELNQGQTDSQVKFLSRGGGYTMFLTQSEAVLSLKKPSGARRQLSASRRLPFASRLLWPARNHGPRTTDALFPPLIQNLKSHIPSPPAPSPESLAPDVVRLKLVGGNPKAKVVGLDPLPGKSNYLIGNDPKKWRRNVPTFAKVSYHDVYPGVDLVFYGNQQQLEYDFIIAPGTDPKVITLSMLAHSLDWPHELSQQPGTSASVNVDSAGDLLVQTASGEVRFRKPNVYQEIAATEKGGPATPTLVDGHYVLKGGGKVGFQVGTYDPARPLVIDPTLAFSTYLGGSGDETASNRIGVDRLGYIYVAGATDSVDFPRTSGAFQPGFAGGSPCTEWGTPDYGFCGDGFIVKLNPTGTALAYSTYIGGTGDDGIITLAIDSSGNTYVGGYTNSTNFPMTAGAFQNSFQGGNPNIGWDTFGDAFVSELNSSGSGLVYSTYLGGSENEYVEGIAVDALGKIYAAGRTDSLDFPTTSGSYQTVWNGVPGDWNGDFEAGFIAKIDPSLSGSASLIYSTYLDGIYFLYGGLGLDADGNAYVSGVTNGWMPFPTTPGALQTKPGSPTGSNGFVAKLNATGSALVYSTFLGGSSGNDGNSGMTVDSSGNAYVGGWTNSTDFPVTPGAFQTTLGAKSDPSYTSGFVVKLNAAGSRIYGTYIGGSGNDGDNLGAVDSAGNVFLVGSTTSTDFPVLNPVQSTLAGSYDAVVVELNPAGSALVYSTYLGGTNNDGPYTAAVDSSDNAYILVGTQSSDFPTTPGVLQTQLRGNSDLVVAKISPASNTSAGANVAAQLTSKAAVRFSGVTEPGTTAVTQTSVGPPAPTGFTLGSPATYIELSTTATYSGSITVCFNYAGITFPGGVPQLFHYENGNWVDVTSSVDTVNQVVCGSVTSFSPFALFSEPIVSLSMGPQAMEGNPQLSAGATLQVGYDFTMPGRHPTATVSFTGSKVTFAWRCVSGPGSGVLVVPMADQSYADEENSPAWYPRGDQDSSLVYQGSIAVPNVCSG